MYIRNNWSLTPITHKADFPDAGNGLPGSGGQMGRKQYPLNGNTGALGFQVGTTSWTGNNGWGQNTSGGVALYYERCESKECENTGPSPDTYTADYYLVGVTVRADGTKCFLFGLILTWPNISVGWDLP